MRCTVTIDVEPSRISATLGRRGREIRTGSVALTMRDALADCLTTLIAPLPRLRLRPHVAVRLGFPFAQIKCVEGLPPSTNRQVLSRVVRENASAFFLRTGPLAIPGAHVAPNGGVWAAAYDRSVIDDVGRVIGTRGWTITSVAPTQGALTATGATLPMQAITLLAKALRPGARERSTHFGITAAGLVVVGIALAASAPVIHRRLWERSVTIELDRARTVRREVASTSAELSRVTRKLTTVNGFAAHRGEMTAFLARLAEALPESTAISTLRADSAEVTMVVITPRAADVVTALAELDSGGGPRLTSSVTPEAGGGVRLERAAFRVQRRRVAPTPKRTPTRVPPSAHE